MKRFIYTILSKTIKSFSKDKIVSKEFGDFKKRLFFEKAQHLNFLFKSKIKYEENIQGKLRQYIKAGDLVFDIGANIGQYALPFSEIVGDAGKVISFEPDYKNYSFLQFNININRCTNVTCHNCGVGGNDTDLEFFRDTETGGRMGSFKKEFVGTNFKGFIENVNLKKFDSLISIYGIPNFVKIDVEGFEKEVLSGLTANLNQTVFLIEVREETKKEVFDFFKEKGFHCTCIDGQDLQINKFEEIPSFANLIFKCI